MSNAGADSHWKAKRQKRIQRKCHCSGSQSEPLDGGFEVGSDIYEWALGSNKW